MAAQKHIEIIGVPIDFSAFGHDAGCAEGPGTLRSAGLMRALNKYAVPHSDDGDIAIPPAQESDNPRLKHLAEITMVTQAVYARVSTCFEKNRFPLVIGGDHSGSIGTLQAAADHYGSELSVLYIDSHADANTEETTPSGNIHGMVVPQFTAGGTPSLMDIGKTKMPFRNMALFGLKNVDDPEWEYIAQHSIAATTIWDIERDGIDRTISDALTYLLSVSQKIYVSLYLDVIDHMHAPGVGTPTYGGLTLREAQYLFRALRQLYVHNQIAGLDVMELNPTLDQDTKTARLAVELIMSLLGFDYGPYTTYMQHFDAPEC